MLSKEKIQNIKVTWKTLPYPEMKKRLAEICDCKDMSFLDMVSALYWSYVEAIKEGKT